MNTSSGEVLRITEDSGEPSLQAAKWLQHRMLLDSSEMENLLEELGRPSIFRVGSLIKAGEEQVASQTFLEQYAAYIAPLKQGSLPDLALFRRQFALVMTLSPEVLFALRVSPEERIVRAALPIIQIQAHAMHYSQSEGQFRSMVFGPDCITWGLQFSYPQIYQDSATKEIIKVVESDRCVNTPLYRKLLRWQRTHTRPTPMVVEEGRLINIPVRLGYSCFSWVNSHAQLVEKHIRVVENHEGGRDVD